MPVQRAAPPVAVLLHTAATGGRNVWRWTNAETKGESHEQDRTRYNTSGRSERPRLLHGRCPSLCR
ncbi:hypothetical protein FTUN_8712 [Frigoriglobus tundricola]|uniref:Uncharacterized protein n=1 Tax=Frigoriglobus tundricola TaxID=2774151 RepID=A0A6M5Z794_9BACT|nr:hypothetical protein FTUN_8712 [Frigoriglobus tundricola]